MTHLRDFFVEWAARRRGIETALRTQWYERYRAAQLECTLGDPELGLRIQSLKACGESRSGVRQSASPRSATR